ncbi:MAG TPA: ribonuclease H-like domain-containing protein [Planctomycetota bacterium]
MPHPIAFDIEVAGFHWDEVDEITRGYLLQRAKTEEDRASAPDRTALYPGLGKIIAIGMWNLEKDRGLCLLEGKHAEQADWKRVPGSEVFRGSEKELLERFWDVLERKRPRLVSFNGRYYDGPILMLRSAQLGVAPSLNLCGNRYNLTTHVDLTEVLSFHGAWREQYKLDYWCRRFDIESPKGSIDGSQIARAYREGRIEEIGEYCLRDTRATAQLFRKLEDTLLPLFLG